MKLHKSKLVFILFTVLLNELTVITTLKAKRLDQPEITDLVKEHGYILLKYLAGGATSKVYTALGNKGEVVLKVSLTPENLIEMQKEVKNYKLLVTRKVCSININKLEESFEIKTQSGLSLVMVMKKLENLSVYIKGRSYKEIKEVFLQMTSGLIALHAVKLIHGDIKPDNFLIDSKTVKLTDFGTLNEPKPFVEGKKIARTASTKEFDDYYKLYYGANSYEQDIWALGMSFVQILNDKAIELVSYDGGKFDKKEWCQLKMKFSNNKFVSAVLSLLKKHVFTEDLETRISAVKLKEELGKINVGLDMKKPLKRQTTLLSCKPKTKKAACIKPLVGQNSQSCLPPQKNKTQMLKDLPSQSARELPKLTTDKQVELNGQSSLSMFRTDSLYKLFTREGNKFAMNQEKVEPDRRCFSSSQNQSLSVLPESNSSGKTSDSPVLRYFNKIFCKK